jgi:hypothetical protein
MTGGEWSDMDAQPWRVQRIILANLGIEPDRGRIPDPPRRLHGAVARRARIARPGRSLAAETEEANRMRGAYEPAALADVLNYVWFGRRWPRLP